MKLFVLLLLSLSTSLFSAEYAVDTGKSLVKWHLLIKSNTNVYGEIKLTNSSLDLEAKKGELNFELKETKSWELDDGKKDFSEARDERIVKITGADDHTPIFTLTDLKKHGESEGKSNYTFMGKLKLNGVEKKVSLTGTIEDKEGALHLVADYKLKWKEFDIDNPVIWILRATSTPEDEIQLNFELILKPKA